MFLREVKYKFIVIYEKNKKKQQNKTRLSIYNIHLSRNSG